MPNATLADLFGSDLLMHFMADGANKLFTDTGGTSAVADGNTVKCWKPESDAAFTAWLTEATNGPTYRANYNSTGYAGIEFDGTNDVLSSSAIGFTTAQRAFIAAVLTPIGTSNTSIWTRGQSGSHYLRGMGSTTQLAAQSPAGTLTSVNTVVNARRCVAWCFLANQTQIDARGFSVGNHTDLVTASLSGWFTVGALNQGTPTFSQFGNFVLHELYAVSGSIEWGQIIRSTTILRNKWGITDDNPIPQTVSAGRPIGRKNFEGGIGQ